MIILFFKSGDTGSLENGVDAMEVEKSDPLLLSKDTLKAAGPEPSTTDLEKADTFEPDHNVMDLEKPFQPNFSQSQPNCDMQTQHSDNSSKPAPSQEAEAGEEEEEEATVAEKQGQRTTDDHHLQDEE